MFGIKFRTWMESHIVRPRKKQRSKDGSGGSGSKGKSAKVVPERTFVASTGHSPPSPTSHKKDSTPQVPRCTFPAPTSHVGHVETITLSTPNHHGYSGPTNNLSSPESAYSTGYSTDGTSPGAGSFPPPEYYINIRTGTHYFSASNTSSFASNTPHPVPSGQTVSPRTSLVSSSPDGSHTAAGRRADRDKQSPEILDVYRPPAPHSHRRTESCGESRSILGPSSLTTAQLTASPRQRTRIRTNPWLSSNTSNSGFKNRHSTIDSNTSSSSGFVKGVAESCSSHGSTSDKHSPRRKCAVKELDRKSICSISSSTSCGSDGSDDLTLNEMMGKFDESYIYEKETDILSDSDPTDCDETDFEAGQEGGDERDTQDEEEFDFIDNGSLVDLPFDVDNDKASNKGHCTYHDFARKPRFRDCSYRRPNVRGKEEKESPALKRASVGKDHLPNKKSSRDSSKYSRQDSNNGSQSHSKSSSEKKRSRNSVRKSARERNLQSMSRNENGLPLFNDNVHIGEMENGSSLNFNRILMQKMLSRDKVVGTRSAGNTPLSLRKKVFANNINSPKKTIHTHSNAFLHINRERDLDLSLLNDGAQKRRSNSVCYARTTHATRENKCLTSFSSELALIEADQEADLKYKQLILEAEKILTTMKDNVPNKTFKHLLPKPNFLKRKMGLENDHVLAKPNDLSKSLIDHELTHLKQRVTRSENRSPRAVQTVTANNESHVEMRRNSVQDERLLDSDSDGSITPRQEEFYEKPLEHFKNLNLHVNVQIESHSSNPYLRGKEESILSERKTVQERCWARKLDVNENSSNAMELRKSVKSLKAFDDSRLDGKLRENWENESRNNIDLNECSPIMRRRKMGDSNGLIVPKVARCPMGKRELLDGSEQRKLSLMVKSPTLVCVSRPPLVAFRSVDLGNQLDASSYCPQSEPVKRKVYTCSATFDRLQKSLVEKGQGQLNNSITLNKPDNIEDDSRNALREKLEQLRRQRDDKEHEPSPGPHHRRQMSLVRRQMLVNTIEGLKRSLEDQSARLKATYGPGQINKTDSKKS